MINEYVNKKIYGNFTERFKYIKSEINNILKIPLNDENFNKFYRRYYAKKKTINIYQFLKDNPDNIEHINENIYNYVDILRLYKKYYKDYIKNNKPKIKLKLNNIDLRINISAINNYHILNNTLYEDMMKKLEVLEFEEELKNSIPINNSKVKLQKF